MMRSLCCFDGALMPGNKNDKKIMAFVAHSPIKTTAFLAMIFLSFLLVGSARAETGTPQWTVTSVSAPTNFAPSAQNVDSYLVTVENTGGSATDGSTITVTDELPSGLSLAAAGVSGEDPLNGTHLGCVNRSCTYTGVVVPDEALVIEVPVDVASAKQLKELPEPTCPVPAEAVSCLTNVVRVSGGGAPDAAISTPTAISSTRASFGISPGGAATSLSSNQAGAHPDLTTAIAFNTADPTGALAGAPKNVTDALPPGFAGDLVDTPSCSTELFSIRACPIGSQIGVVTLTITLFHKPRETAIMPVYNLAPNPGEVAKLAFYALNVFAVEGEVALRPSDYGLNAVFYDTNETPAELDSVSLTVWGVPALAVHDALRWQEGPHALGHFGVASDAQPVPFFTNPTACSGQKLAARFTADSWEQPESYVEESMPFGPIARCDGLSMAPTLSILPTTTQAYSPTGLHLEMGIPQTYQSGEGLATANLDSAVVALPEGVTVNPSAGAGLGACTQAQYEAEPVQAVPGEGCPSNSKLGSVEIETPSLKEPVLGSVYVAQPYANPFSEPGHPNGSLLALYVVARIPERGVLVKAAGKVALDPVTGRLVTSFEDLPPLPFGELTFRLREGATAPLVTPPACGDYSAQAQLTPWSELSGAPLEPPIAPFAITTGVGGGPCPGGGGAGGIPFAPGVTAGTENNDAGSYSPLDIRISRNDGEQEITGFATQLPPGLTGNLSGVEQCSEAQIALARGKTGAEEQAGPSCPAGSEIGHTIAEAGVGAVLVQTPGKIYLGGPYNGSGPCTTGESGCAPFSVVAITSAKVGPFDLGTVVVHLPLFIDPVTAQVTVGSGSANQIPHIIKGIVIHLRNIDIYINGGGRNLDHFTLNPTNCTPSTLSATVIGGGAEPANPADNNPVTITDPFQAANCANLKFEPKFQVSTSGKTSKANGASLHVNLTYPAGALTHDTNIKQVKVELPKQLPSRLTTLQKACTQAQFKANPAGCPAASLIGTAKAITPILPVPLEGPVYFVSNGGEAFPNLIMVLQGDGVTIDLVGDTFISKSGITSSTFKAVPDQPVQSFELTLPEGKFSALAANGNLCAVTKTVVVKKKVPVKVKGRKKTVTRKVKETQAASLAMPTEMVGQNGDTIHQSTPVSVTGCGKAKVKKPAKHKPKKKGRK